MNGHGKSDRPVVPMKSPNNAGQPVAEEMEGRGLAKGNLQQQNAPRTLSRQGAPSALERVRQAASRDRKMRFTTLLHHIYDLQTLRVAYLSLKRDAAAGVDGETWRHYGERLEENLQELADRLKRGAYRAKPVRHEACSDFKYSIASCRQASRRKRSFGFTNPPIQTSCIVIKS